MPDPPRPVNPFGVAAYGRLTGRSGSGDVSIRSVNRPRLERRRAPSKRLLPGSPSGGAHGERRYSTAEWIASTATQPRRGSHRTLTPQCLLRCGLTPGFECGFRVPWEPPEKPGRMCWFNTRPRPHFVHRGEHQTWTQRREWTRKREQRKDTGGRGSIGGGEEEPRRRRDSEDKIRGGGLGEWSQGDSVLRDEELEQKHQRRRCSGGVASRHYAATSTSGGGSIFGGSAGSRWLACQNSKPTTRPVLGSTSRKPDGVLFGYTRFAS